MSYWEGDYEDGFDDDEIESLCDFCCSDAADYFLKNIDRYSVEEIPGALSEFSAFSTEEYYIFVSSIMGGLRRCGDVNKQSATVKVFIKYYRQWNVSREDYFYFMKLPGVEETVDKHNGMVKFLKRCPPKYLSDLKFTLSTNNMTPEDYTKKFLEEVAPRLLRFEGAISGSTYYYDKDTAEFYESDGMFILADDNFKAEISTETMNRIKRWVSEE